MDYDPLIICCHVRTSKRCYTLEMKCFSSYQVVSLCDLDSFILSFDLVVNNQPVFTHFLVFLPQRRQRIPTKAQDGDR